MIGISIATAAAIRTKIDDLANESRLKLGQQDRHSAAFVVRPSVTTPDVRRDRYLDRGATSSTL
jgi:hypothetical protein